MEFISPFYYFFIGFKTEESLCVFRLIFVDGELQRPVLHRHKALTGVHLSVCQRIYFLFRSPFQCFPFSDCAHLFMSFCLFVCLSTYLYVCLSVYLSLCHSVCLSVRPFICQSVSLSICFCG